MNNTPPPFPTTLKTLSRFTRDHFLLLAILVLTLLLPLNTQAFAQSDLAEIEFWQSVKTSQDPSELQAYLDLFPQGKFAPLARIRIKKLTSESPTRPVEPTRVPAPAPPIELPVFKPDNATVTDAICRRKLGPRGIAAADFGGNASICLCSAPFEISEDGASCVRSSAIDAAPKTVIPPRKKIRRAVAKPPPVRVKRRPPPAREIRRPIQRGSVKRPPKAQARAIANRYCRRRYGKDLKRIEVKKSKFYCYYQVGDSEFLGVKKKKFKDVSR